MIVKIHGKWDDIFNGLVSKVGSKKSWTSAKQRDDIRITKKKNNNNNKKTLKYKENKPNHKIILLIVIVRENRAVPKDRGRPFTFIFSQYKSYPKRLTAMTFAEAGVRISLRDHRNRILAFLEV